MEILARHPAGLTLTDMAEEAGLTRAGARRFLLTLTATGYAVQTGRRFTLSPRLLSVARTWLQGASLWTYAEPFMREVSAGAERILLGRGAVGRGRRLCRARRRPAHLQRRAACRHTAAGLVHLDGPRAAVRPAAGRNSRNSWRRRRSSGGRQRASSTAQAARNGDRQGQRNAVLPSSTRSWRSGCARSPCRSATIRGRSSRRSTSRRSRRASRRRDGAGDPAATCCKAARSIEDFVSL